MADLTIIYWRDIPAQVVAKQGRRSAKRELPPRFAEAIDMAAMRSGARDDQGDLDEWRRGMEALIPYPNLWCKVSGLLTEAGPGLTAERIRPVVQFALERFGAGRLMWGSDWPVCLLAADYRTTHQTVAAALGPLPAADRAALFGGNAVRFYAL